MSLKVKSKGIDGYKPFSRFLDALEQNVFKDCEFIFLQNKSTMLTEFMRADKFGEYYLFMCKLDALQNEYIDMINREAQIRLLDIVIKEIQSTML